MQWDHPPADPICPEAKGYLALPQGAKFFEGEVKAEPLIRDVSLVIPVYRAKNHKKSWYDSFMLFWMLEFKNLPELFLVQYEFFSAKTISPSYKSRGLYECAF